MPQLNPEFFISQLFWLFLTFLFLLIFLWKISLPRISSVLEKREKKINEDINSAKKLQAEAEEIQKDIDSQLRKAKEDNDDLIKQASLKFQDNISKELEEIDNNLNKKLEESSSLIEKNKTDSLQKIDDQIFDITKLALIKVANIKVDNNEINKVVSNTKQQIVN
tara:strand:+ start:104 stop:598 length:495 start_codon:yes stop_codon:yes gene_type:complete